MPAGTLARHNLAIALLRPQIAPNTGNIGRLCVATGTPLHLVRPLGFILNDKSLLRSAMDYWPRLNLTVHDDTAQFLAAMGARPLWLFTTKATRAHWQASYESNACLCFGSETSGLDQSLLDRYPDRCIRIPQAQGERCLNLSTSAGIGLYEALRQIAPP
jgi:tRNA (cytidine/uridine-2'-O-)-methyltransferase